MSPQKSVSGLLIKLGAEAPSSIAIVDPNGELTYQHLDRRSRSIAAHLRKRGIRSEEVVSVFLPRSAVQIVAILGVLRAGAACLPLDESEPPRRLNSILEDGNPRLVITSRALEAHIQKIQTDR